MRWRTASLLEISNNTADRRRVVLKTEQKLSFFGML